MHFKMISLSSIMCLMGLCICISMADLPKCPQREELYQCSCSDGDYLHIDCNAHVNDDPSIKALQTALDNLPAEAKLHLYLSHYEIETLPSKLFQGFQINEMVLSKFHFNTFESNEPAFTGLEDSLQELYIISSLNRTSLFSSQVNIGHLRKLKKLEIADHSKLVPYYNRDNEIVKFDSWFESGPSSLEVLNIYNNRISDLGDDVFAMLINLKELDLQYNRISALKRSMFPSPADQLAVINLDNNVIQDLPEDIFHNMPALREVHLRNNLVENLDQKVWEPIWEQLDVFQISKYLNCDRRVIEWMIDLKLPEDLNAYCFEPDEVKNKNLDEVLDEMRG